MVSTVRRMKAVILTAVFQVVGIFSMVPTHSMATPTEAPFGLNGPDGQGLELVSLAVKVAAHGPLALTEYEMSFRNPKDRQIEGKFRIDLPPRATISRFAKEVDGQLMEGEVVERLKATRIYTEILHSMRDPALLEMDQGNRFKARIFPIPARSTLRILFSYTTLHPMGPEGERKVEVPLTGLGTIERFDYLVVCRPLPGEAVQLADASGASIDLKSMDKIVFADEGSFKQYAPTQNLVLAFRPGPQSLPSHRVVAGDFQMVTFRAPKSGGDSISPPDRWHVFLDTSASAAVSRPHRSKAYRQLIEALSVRRNVKVSLFDRAVVDRGQVPAGSAECSAYIDEIVARGYLGATDLAAVLDSASKSASSTKEPMNVVLVTDGIPTMGERDSAKLIQSLGKWPAHVRLHVLVVGGVQDAHMASGLARAGGGRVVEWPFVEGFEDQVSEMVQKLERPSGATYEVYDEGATWIEPKTFDDVQPGQEIVVFSQLKKSGVSEVGVTDRKGFDQTIGSSIATEPEFAPLLERESYHALMERLRNQRDEAEDSAKRQVLAAKELELSIKHRILCPQTSLLVLETVDDYQRFGIDRRARADILTVGKKGIQPLQRIGGDLAGPEIEVRAKDEKKLSPPRSPSPAEANHRPRAEEELSKSDLVESGETSDFEAEEDKSMESNSLLGAEGDDVSGLDQSITEASSAPGSSEGQFAEAMPDVSAGFGGGGGVSFSAESGDREAPSDFMTQAELAAPAPEPMQDGFDLPSAFPAASSPAERASATRMMLAPAAPPPPPPPSSPRLRASAMPSSGSRQNAMDRLVGPDASPPRPAPMDENSSSQAPDWITQASQKPSESSLAGLRDRISKQPMDLALRNAMGLALRRMDRMDDLEVYGFEWQALDPENPLVYEFLGDSFDARGEDDQAGRAYSSIAEVAPGDSGILNRAGFLALRSGDAKLAEDLFRVAIERRPEHQNNYRGLALALWTQERFEDAAQTLMEALSLDYNSRYGDVKRILREELGWIIAAWKKSHSDQAVAFENRSPSASGAPEPGDDLRITLHWETDANDVDLHVVDPHGEECFYSHLQNRSGLNLYQDLTQGLGPETAVVPRGGMIQGPYHIGVKYFAAGPMGVSRGIVVLQEPSEGARPKIQIVPFVLLPDLEGQEQDMRHVAVFEP